MFRLTIILIFKHCYLLGFSYDIGTDPVMDCCWKLRVAKGQSTPSAASQPSHKNVSQSEWDLTPPSSNQQTTVSANTFERSETDAVEELPAAEYEGYYVYFFCCRIGYYHVPPFIIYSYFLALSIFSLPN
jgi:hypothetical protein